ncbi:phospholipid transfer protein-like isoform X2 [Toxotes jaculatrix]|uniref:phospholipid transfer protein-like isoform X2 n=1 Tax=Toxotes jaculatrix TaxID=941984 RepID=UPI001B3AB2F3|nr:phospholipid transfer protein-like isoform X2 [Toxotes jaculatrix]
MTSCVFSFLFSISLFSSITAVDPAGLKIRITNRALSMLKDQALAFLQEGLVNRPFEERSIGSCTIQRAVITQLAVNQADLRFQANSGFQFVIQNFGFTITFDRQLNLYIFRDTGTSTFEAEGVNVNMAVSLFRNDQGRLNVAVSNCEASANGMVSRSTGPLRRVWDNLLPCVRHLFNHLFCPVVQRYGVTAVNRMLDTVNMDAELFPDFGISIDYSLIRDVQVTAASLDLSFKGLAHRRGEAAAVTSDGVDPVFPGNERMAYLGVSQLFFDSAAVSFYNAGAMGKKLEEVTSVPAKVLLRLRQFFTQPWRLSAPLSAEVGLTEAPRIRITPHGVTVNVRARLRAASTPPSRAPHVIASVSATCEVSVRVTVDGNRLTLPYQQVSCSVVTSNSVKQQLVKPLNTLLTNRISDFMEGWFARGVQLPLPEGVSFTQGTIQYHDGFALVGGDLDFSAEGRRNLQRHLGGEQSRD